jgi:pimeloyl-ACP methyl ester carboxylesterase
MEAIMQNATIIAPNTIRTAGHVDLVYRDWGAGRPVLFVAGWSLPSDSWNDQMLALHAAVMEALDLKDVTLVGHSMGRNEIVRCMTACLSSSQRPARMTPADRRRA